MPLIVSVSIAGGMTVPKRRSSRVRKKLHFRGGFSLFLLHSISISRLLLPLHGGGGSSCVVGAPISRTLIVSARVGAPISRTLIVSARALIVTLITLNVSSRECAFSLDLSAIIGGLRAFALLSGDALASDLSVVIVGEGGPVPRQSASSCAVCFSLFDMRSPTSALIPGGSPAIKDALYAAL